MGEGGWTARRIAAAIAIGVGLLLIAEWLWVTDTERIEGRLDSMCRAIEQGEMAGAIGAFSNDFAIIKDGRMVLSKPQLSVAFDVAFDEGIVKRLNVRESTIAVSDSGTTAVTEVVFNATAKRDDGGFPGTVRVKFAWAREDGGWRITSIADTSADAFVFEWFGNPQPLWGPLKNYVRRGARKQ